MINFWDAVLGFIIFIVGIVIIVFTIIKTEKDYKDPYGNTIGLYTGAILMIMGGLGLFLREIFKL
jgi:hypothetical protein